MIRISDFHGRTVAQSHNLRAVPRFARKHPVEVVRVFPRDTPSTTYLVAFYFHNDDGLPFSCEMEWQDIGVLLDWLTRRRTWSITRVSLSAETYHYAVLDACRAVTKLREKGTVVHQT